MRAQTKEQELKIPIPGTKLFIYGTLRGGLNYPIVVLIHGLTGHKNEHIHYNGARFFADNGFSSLRINLYDSAKDARKLEDCTLTVHAADLDTTIGYLRSMGFKQIFVCGHSFGGTTILFSKDRQFLAAALWDPYHAPIFGLKQQGWQHVPSIHRYTNSWSRNVYISEAMYKENLSLNCDKLAASFHVPTKVIYAQKGPLRKAARSYYRHLAGNKEIVGIKNATHSFDEEGAEEQLFTETLKWFKKFS